MPWSIATGKPGCSGYAVVVKATGKVVGCHPTKAKAQAQLAALNINVKEAMMQTEDLRREISSHLAAIEVRSEEDSQPVLAGHFARFNEWTEIDSVFEGRFLERVMPGAFIDSFAARTPKITFNHGRDPDLGDKILGSPVTVGEDELGGTYSAPLFPGVPPLLVDGLRAGAYGSSFRFNVTAEDVARKPERSEHNPEGLPERSIVKASVFEIGPVTFPAYEGATAGVRSATDEFRPATETVAEMYQRHPSELIRMLEQAKGTKRPKQVRFRTREEWLKWV